MRWLSLLLFFPLLVSAHGGDQRIVGDKYLVSLSRAPFTPIAGERADMVLYFFDLKKNQLAEDEIIADVKIAKLGEVTSEKANYLYEEKEIPVEGGALELPFAFGEPGLHEVFVEFALESDRKTTYEPDDFVVDVREPKQEEFAVPVPWDLMALSFAAGIAAVFLGQDIRKRLRGG